MPIISGRVRDFGLKSLTDQQLRIVFVPSNPAATGADGVLVGPVVVENSQIDAPTGIFETELAQTTLLQPPTHFRIRVEFYSRTGDRLDGMVELDWELHVPAGDRSLKELLDLAPPAGTYMFGHGPPPPGVPPRGVFYVDLSTPGGRLNIYGEPGAIA